MTWKELLDLIFGVSFILLGKLGDHLEEHPRHYSCPTYCDVDHIHIIPKEKSYEIYLRYELENNDSLYTISDISNNN